MSGGLIPPLPRIDHFRFGCLGPGHFSLEHVSIRVPEPIWVTFFSIWQWWVFSQVSRQLFWSGALCPLPFLPSLSTSQTALLFLYQSHWTAEGSAKFSLSSLLRYNTLEKLFSADFGWEYGNIPPHLLKSCSVSLGLWGLCGSERVIARKCSWLSLDAEIC